MALQLFCCLANAIASEILAWNGGTRPEKMTSSVHTEGENFIVAIATCQICRVTTVEKVAPQDFDPRVYISATSWKRSCNYEAAGFRM